MSLRGLVSYAGRVIGSVKSAIVSCAVPDGSPDDDDDGDDPSERGGRERVPTTNSVEDHERRIEIARGIADEMRKKVLSITAEISRHEDEIRAVAVCIKRDVDAHGKEGVSSSLREAFASKRGLKESKVMELNNIKMQLSFLDTVISSASSEIGARRISEAAGLIMGRDADERVESLRRDVESISATSSSVSTTIQEVLDTMRGAYTLGLDDLASASEIREAQSNVIEEALLVAGATASSDPHGVVGVSQSTLPAGSSRSRRKGPTVALS